MIPLEEVHRAASLAGFMKPLAWLFWAASIVGARISPLHGPLPDHQPCRGPGRGQGTAGGAGQPGVELIDRGCLKRS